MPFEPSPMSDPEYWMQTTEQIAYATARILREHAEGRTASSRRLLQRQRDTPMGLLRKYNRVTGQSVQASESLHVPVDMAPYPATWEFISMMVWEEDGSARTPGTILLFADSAGVKVMLNDKDGSRVAFGVVDASEGVFASVEAMLLSTMTDWRQAHQNGWKSKK